MPHTYRPIWSKGCYLYFFLKCIINLIYSPDVLHHSIFVKKISTKNESKGEIISEKRQYRVLAHAVFDFLLSSLSLYFKNVFYC